MQKVYPALRWRKYPPLRRQRVNRGRKPLLRLTHDQRAKKLIRWSGTLVKTIPRHREEIQGEYTSLLRKAGHWYSFVSLFFLRGLKTIIWQYTNFGTQFRRISQLLCIIFFLFRCRLFAEVQAFQKSISMELSFFVKLRLFLGGLKFKFLMTEIIAMDDERYPILCRSKRIKEMKFTVIVKSGYMKDLKSDN